MKKPEGIALETTSIARVGFRLVQDRYELSTPEELDVFTSLYEPEPKLKPSVDEEHIPWHRAMGEVMESAMYQGMHTETMLDEELSGVAVRPFMNELQPLVERFRELERRRRELQESLDVEEHARLEREERLVSAEVTQIVARAVSEARDAMDTVIALRSMGYGNEAGRFVSLHYKDLPKIRELVKRTHAQFGRFRELFAAARAGTPRRAAMVRGVTLGDEIHRATSSELALLGDKDTENLFYQKWAEKRLMVRDINRPQEKRRGDVVVLVDESGSMSGEPVIIAKAYVFALRAQLRQENRKCRIISFSYREEDMVELPDDATAEQVVQWLGRFIDGGTDFEAPLRRAMQSNRDILMITDGEARVSDEFRSEFVEWKRRTGNRFFLIHIGSNPTLHPLADEVILSTDAASLWARLVE
jgi:uncharacterized protein with von Willebrand factor type A (vWA) domain